MKNIISTALITTLIAYTIYAIVTNIAFSKQTQCEQLVEQQQTHQAERMLCGLE